jgi:Secretion system C-terminal sorting domain
MKKIAIQFIFALFTPVLFAQNAPPCWYTENWDWTDPAEQNWYAYVNTFGGGLSPQAMGSPFVNPTANSDIYNIVEAGDFQKSQGWVLLYKNFGCSGNPVDGNVPYFFLYNRYTAVVRMFFKNYADESYHEAQVILKWLGNVDNTGLLAIGNKYTPPVKAYPGHAVGEQMMNYVQDYYSEGAWFTTEFPVSFDQNTNAEMDSDLLIEVFNVALSTLDLDGNLEFQTKSAGQKDSEALVPTVNGDEKSFLVDAKEFLGKVPKSADIKSFYDNFDNGISDIDSTIDNRFTNGMHDLADQFLDHTSDIKGFLIGASQTAVGLSSGIDVALSVLSFFTGKAASTTPAPAVFQPTLSSGSLTLSGTLTTKTNGTAVQMQLPGTNHFSAGNQNIQYVGKPIYDCPLGNLALEEIPQISYREYLDHFGDVFVDYVFSNEGSATDETTGAYIKSRSYKLFDNIKLALNAAARLRVDTILVGFMGISDLPAYDIKNYQTGDNWNTVNNADAFINNHTNFPFSAQFVGPAAPDHVEALSNGLYQLYSRDTISHRHSFGTSLVDLAHFRGATFKVPASTQIFLKVVAILRPIDEDAVQTPVLWSCTYEIPEDKLVPAGPPLGSLSSPQQVAMAVNYPSFPFTFEQMWRADGDLHIHNEVVQEAAELRNTIVTGPEAYIDPILGPVELDARIKISMQPGTRVMSYPNLFRARIVPDNSIAHGTSGGSVNTYFQECANQYRNAVFGNEEAGENTNELLVFPNPTDGCFTIRWKVSQGESIVITNIMGEVIYSLKIDDKEGQANVDFSKFASGLYVVKTTGLASDSKFVKLILEQ